MMPYNLRPWVWVTVLALGPFIAGALSTQNMFVYVRCIPTSLFLPQMLMLNVVEDSDQDGKSPNAACV